MEPLVVPKYIVARIEQSRARQGPEMERAFLTDDVEKLTEQLPLRMELVISQIPLPLCIAKSVSALPALTAQCISSARKIISQKDFSQGLKMKSKLCKALNPACAIG